MDFPYTRYDPELEQKQREAQVRLKELISLKAGIQASIQYLETRVDFSAEFVANARRSYEQELAFVTEDLEWEQKFPRHHVLGRGIRGPKPGRPYEPKVMWECIDALVKDESARLERMEMIETVIKTDRHMRRRFHVHRREFEEKPYEDRLERIRITRVYLNVK